jgi:dTDP-4-amino-4,6-dideoxygalactose transaminase
LEETKELKGFQLFPTVRDTTIQQVPFVSCLAILCDKSQELIDALLKEDIFCRKYYKPLVDLPKSTDYYDRIVCISFTKDMTNADVERIVKILRTTLVDNI